MTDKLADALKAFHASKHDRKYQSQISTIARIGNGHSGGHVLTADWLGLQADFSGAKDAVASHLDVDLVRKTCDSLGLPHILVQSRVQYHLEHLMRPDLGRMMSDDSAVLLNMDANKHKDIVVLVSAGLSAKAIEEQLPQFLPQFHQHVLAHHLTIAPIIINQYGRVALGDEVNDMLRAQLTVVLIGERPGLGNGDSMSIYLTYNARKGCTDESRNCISNIHQHGLSPADAALKLSYLIRKSLALQLSGIGLKDDQSENLTLL